MEKNSSSLDTAPSIVPEPPLEYDYTYLPSKNVITYNKERIARIKRCFACLDRRAEEEGAESTPPITPANLSLCTGMTITTDHLRTMTKRGILAEVGRRKSSPFSRSSNLDAAFKLIDKAAAPYRIGQRCGYDPAHYKKILEGFSAKNQAIIAHIAKNHADGSSFSRVDVCQVTGTHKDVMRRFVSRFTVAGYIEAKPEDPYTNSITKTGKPFFVFADAYNNARKAALARKRSALAYRRHTVAKKHAEQLTTRIAELYPQKSAQEQAAIRTTIERCLAIGFLTKDGSGYRLGGNITRYHPNQVTAFMYVHGIDFLVTGKHLNGLQLTAIVQKLYGVSPREFIKPMADQLAHANLTVEQKQQQAKEAVRQCIGCIASRGVHTTDGLVRASQFAACRELTSRRVGTSLRQLADEEPRLVLPYPYNSGTIYLLTAEAGQQQGSIPENCAQIIPARPPLKRLAISNVVSPWIRERLAEATAGKNQTNAQEALRFCLERKIVKVAKVDPRTVSQKDAKSAAFNRTSGELVAFGEPFATEREAVKQAVAYYFGLDILLYGSRLDSRRLKHALGLGSADNLADFTQKTLQRLMK